MQSPEICPSCNNELNHAGAFCKHCGIQARCNSCQGLLEVDSRFCASCGLAAGSASSEELVKSPLLGGAVNRIKYEETKSTRSMEAHLTNEAVSDLSSTFLNYIVNGSSSGTQNKKGTFVRPSANHPQLPGTIIQDIHEEAIEAEVMNENGPSSHSTSPNHDAEKIQQIFRLSDGKLSLDANKLKASGQLDYARRLTFLFLYAQEILNQRDKVSINELLDILTEERVNDVKGHCRSWLKSSTDLKRDEEHIWLIKDGREMARKVLNDALDSSVENRWMPGDGMKSRSKNKTKAITEDKASSKSTSSAVSVPNDVNEWTTIWHNTHAGVNGFDLLNDKSLTDRGIFALWCISEVKNDANVVISRDKLAKFIAGTWGVKAAASGSFDNALTNNLAAGKIKKVPGGYQLLPPGVEYAQQMLKVISSAPDASKDKPPKK